MNIIGRYLGSGETSTFVDADGTAKNLLPSQLIQTTNTTDGSTSTITATGDFSFTRATTATRVNSSGLIEDVAASFPRIDFTGGTGHVLMESASTNTATYSNDFSQGTNFNSGNRTLSDCVLSTSQGTAPDGTNTAQKLTDSNIENIEKILSLKEKEIIQI